MSERLHIGQLARLAGRSVHTIRWYETQGLIPGVDRDVGGRRVYLRGHIDHLLFLERMRRTGMSVAEMRRLTELSLQGWRTLPDREALLRDHRAEIELKIEEMRAALAVIDDKLAYYAEWNRRKRRPESEVSVAAE